MKDRKDVFLVLVSLACVFSAGFALADTVDGRVASYSKVTQLLPGSPAYGTWSHWIVEALNNGPIGVDYTNGVAVHRHFDSSAVGLVTVETRFGETVDSAKGTPAAGGHGARFHPSAPLPATGKPGQTVTITDVTHRFHVSWTFTWRTIGGGDGGWEQTAGSFRDCGADADKQASVTCAPL
ncbi:hypothetical protein [Dyella mobilis]|uniref:Uncharacterized protein n=1 Tax=Dyella mobilis TaxID=1849582 RepID=A0ABS2KJ95_9GAMM|nr:hypothetical protein [Dyella mobilis]MBM7131244.1 hypothetical protein [Dyella mobilis]GLQ98819.1 hypothetical protein GCM10007863_32390 [Dyella mobilis]